MHDESDPRAAPATPRKAATTIPARVLHTSQARKIGTTFAPPRCGFSPQEGWMTPAFARHEN